MDLAVFADTDEEIDYENHLLFVEKGSLRL